MLVTERNAGRLRMVRNGVLDPQPISGVPAVYSAGLAGLMEVVLHPRFADNRLVYLSYIKSLGEKRHTPALVRGRLDGMALVDVKELFVADTPGTGPAAGRGDDVRTRWAPLHGRRRRQRRDRTARPIRIRARCCVFAMTAASRRTIRSSARPTSKPEIWSFGHRNMVGLTVHPDTGAIWESENGPQGGDEINIIKKGANYGWPLVSYGRDYAGPRVSEGTSREGMESPWIVWIPSIAASGLTFYTGDRFPNWRRNLFVGGMQFGRIRRTGQMHRIVFNANWDEIRRESLFVDLRQRIRNVRQGPDGLLYVLTDEDDGALLKIEPVK